MININDVKSILSTTTIEELRSEYKSRQKEYSKKNEEIARRILEYYKNDELSTLSNLSDIQKLNCIILKYLNSSKIDAANTLEILKSYKYNPLCELLKLVQRADMYFFREIDEDLFIYSFYGTTLKEGIRALNNRKIKLKTKLGLINFMPIDTVDPNLRRGYCHYLTTQILSKSPNLYGAYYYIPQEFSGFIPHSVIIDYEKKLVYDLANNIEVNLKAWTSFYGEPTLLIKGSDLIKLNEILDHDLGLKVDMATLEQVRRRI